MQVWEAIENRRSIRRFQDVPVSKEDLESILEAGILAPSSKNRQPWRFVVVSGPARAEMVRVMEAGLAREERQPALPDSSGMLPAAQYTRRIMAQAGATIFILNPLAGREDLPRDPESHYYEMANLQSVGACIQNMTLAALERGLGTLWICDIFFACPELCSWLGIPHQMVAALAVGVPEESPGPRPRKSLTSLVEWRDE